ncbi:type IV toxin-antitoxin system AbiEi family antitoxin domain-containing protein [Pseudomonas sp. NPDC089547]|uniref:type IV toxin-antitoxin system AbiEi family antitoxin domain-containing protein n=1 Tax=Pseudomonas sp. NPDC089547 TaxID=3390652 RepID=UPI003CFC0E66
MKGRHHYSLIKELYKTMPRGMLLNLSALQKIGISNQRAACYAKSGWLTRIAHGIYVFPGDSLSLPSALTYLAMQIEGLHVGGASALLERDSAPLVLWGDARTSLPRWFSERFSVRYRHARLFDWQAPSIPEQTLTHARPVLGNIKCSTAERALLEMLYDVGDKQSLEDAYIAFSQVKVMCPHIVGDLLQRCTSIKAKRLFLKWGRECGQLNLDTVLDHYRIPMGSNNRWITRLKDGSMLSLKPYG